MNFGTAMATLLALGAIIGLTYWAVKSTKSEPVIDDRTPEEIAAEQANKLAHRQARAAAAQNDLIIFRLGAIRPQLICPHCQERGQVRCKDVKNKKGISGGKATGALLTGGVSLLATGLSRKEAATAAHCDNCTSEWMF